MGKKRTDITVEGGLCTLEMSSVAGAYPAHTGLQAPKPQTI